MDTDKHGYKKFKPRINTDKHGFRKVLVTNEPMLLEESLTELILGACFDVSNELGSGFLESVYKQALFIVLKQKEIDVETEIPLKVMFRGNTIGVFHVDLLVNQKVILEIKAVKTLLPEHEAQLLNYLKASNLRIGLLVNFGKAKVDWKRMIL